MVDCKKEAEKYLVTILYRSGKSIDQTGLYEDCLADPQFSYYFMNFAKIKQPNLNTRTFLGVCMPKVCDKQTVKENINQLVQVAGLNVFSISQPSQYSYEKGGLFWFTVVWIALLAFLVLLSSLIKIFYKKTHKIVDCFALQQNMKMFTSRESSLKFLNGVKGLCLFWIVLGHSFSIRVVDSQNWISLDFQFTQFINLIPLGAFFAVDIFFLIGGFLLGYVFLSQMKKNNYKMYLMAILHRLLRFYPSYITAMLIWYQIFPHTGTGPFWPLQQFYVDPCKNMWRNILFIDNLYQTLQCMPWAWYLSNDVQLFILCIGLLFAYTRWPKITLGISALLIAGSITFNFVQSQIHQYKSISHIMQLFSWNDYFLKMYIKPWSRAPPYIIGLLLGVQYYKFFKYTSNRESGILTESDREPLLQKIRLLYINKPLIRYIGYIIGFAILFFLMFLPRDLQVGHKWPQIAHTFYLSFSKILFVIGGSIVMLPAILGIKDFIVFFCDTFFFSAIGKISFWAYLIHYMVIMRSSYNLKYGLYFTPVQIYQRYATDLMLSLILAFIFTMVVEAPFVKLQKILLRGGGAEKKAVKDIKQTVISTSNATG